jgi:hypothetical protein
MSSVAPTTKWGQLKVLLPQPQTDERIGFANVFADVTQGERPIKLFRSLHEARAWLAPNTSVKERTAGGRSL